MDSKGAIFVILKSRKSVPIRKERLSPTNKARMEASRNKFVKKAGCQTVSEGFVVVVVISPPLPRDGGMATGSYRQPNQNWARGKMTAHFKAVMSDW